MKKSLLSIIAIFLIGAVQAQVCTPNPAYADEVFGVWPTVDEGFVDGNIGVEYTQVLDFIIPSDAGQIDPAGAGQTIDSVVVLSISGLHDGLSFACNSHTGSACTFLPEIQGCGIISGTPTVSGENVLTIDVLAYVTLFNNPVPLPYQFAGYSINIMGPDAIDELAQYGFALKQNAPNPFDQYSTIEFSLNQSIQVDFQVFDLVGRNVHTRAINASNGVNRINMDASAMGLNTGIYLYTLTIDGQSVTRKMVVK